jgi:hypothetical protein
MSKPIIRIHNVETDEVIDREMNDHEFAQYELDKANDQERVNKLIAKENAKSALLEKLGITEDEAKLLLG